MAKYFHRRDFLHRFRLLPDPGDLLPLHQGEVRGALLPDPGDVLPRRQTTRPRRRAPSPPTQPPPKQPIPSERSAFNTFPRRATGRNLFEEFMSSLPRPFPLGNSRTPSLPPPPPPPTRSPSPDIMLELYTHTRHPLDLRTHLTILPTWSKKAEEETKGECVVCYGMDEHLQIECKNCHTTKVCCMCVVGIYQSINSSPVCRFRGEY